MMSSAPFMRQPSQDGTSQIGASETNALIHAVLALSRERSLALHQAPQVFAHSRPSSPLVRGAMLAALLLAFGGASYWLGARGGQTDTAVATAPAAAVVAATSTAALAQPTAAAQAQVDPALLQALVSALAQAQKTGEAQAKPAAKPAAPVAAPKAPAPAAAAHPPAPQPRPAAAATAPLFKQAPAVATAPQAGRESKDDGVGVSVDLANLGSTASTSAPARTQAPPPQIPPSPPAPVATATTASFSVVGVLDGMVLVQQGRRVSPVGVGQALPDGRLLQSTDTASGKYQAAKP